MVENNGILLMHLVFKAIADLSHVMIFNVPLFEEVNLLDYLNKHLVLIGSSRVRLLIEYGKDVLDFIG